MAVCRGQQPRSSESRGAARRRAGESLLLLNYTHQPAATPYRASHAIFVPEGAERAYDAADVVPEALRRRMISLRAFDAGHDMIDAALVDGRELAAAIDRLLDNLAVRYIQAHYAVRGCYAARIGRDGDAPTDCSMP